GRSLRCGPLLECCTQSGSDTLSSRFLSGDQSDELRGRCVVLHGKKQVTSSESQQLSCCSFDDPQFVGRVANQSFKSAPHLCGCRGMRQSCEERYELVCVGELTGSDGQLGRHSQDHSFEPRLLSLDRHGSWVGMPGSAGESNPRQS